MIRGRRGWLLMALCLMAACGPAGAVELWSGARGRSAVHLTSTLKWSSILSHAPEDVELFPERWSAATLWRWREILAVRVNPWLSAEIAYEQRARAVSEGSGAGGGAGILHTEVRAPYRLAQLDRPLVEIGSTFAHRHELDRALIVLQRGQAEVVIGRQAVGWGRGVYFSAMDIFLPFTPLESDREWRRGIDAVRAGAPLGDRFSVDLVAASGETWKQSALAARLQGFARWMDGELIFGKRCEDIFCAVAVSAPAGGAELHAEGALFQLPEAYPEGGILGRDDLVAKSVLGASTHLNLGTDFLLSGEFHFSGFGFREVGDLRLHLLDPVLRNRFQRGDTQILGRHAAAFQVAWGVGGVLPLSLAWIWSPHDGSGLVTAAGSWMFSDYVTLSGNVYIPHGADSLEGWVRSEYGGTPASGLIQIGFAY